MNKHLIAIKKLNGLYIKSGVEANVAAAHTLSADIIQLGYVMSPDLFNTAATLPKEQLKRLHASIVKTLRGIVGADVVYNPMYPNFPIQVMEADDLELWINAITHYWSVYVEGGNWLPQYTKKERPFFPEDVNLKVLDLVNEEEFNAVFTKILSSNDSISEEDKDIVKHFLVTPELKIIMPEVVPFKENLCMIAADALGRDVSIEPYITNTTDILRLATYLSGGDVSLGSNTKFVSFPRHYRKNIVRVLEKVINPEDIARHANKWVKLFHCLHVGDYSREVYDIAKVARENQKIVTFNGKVESALLAKNLPEALTLLKTRPSEFARRLDYLLRTYADTKSILVSFVDADVVGAVPTRILFQVLGHFRLREQEVGSRVVFPKGSTQKAIILDGVLPALSKQSVEALTESITAVLKDRFSDLEDLGNVYLDPRLRGAPLPVQQRSASSGIYTVARGTKLDIGDKDYLRLFVYWVGQDIDLSATFHDENFLTVANVSYTRLKDETLDVYHSGDITSARNGASEFIDINIEKVLAKGIRYVSMNVLVYSGPTFKEHDTCYAGWMTRERPSSNEVYEPKTVAQKFDITCDSKNSIPVVFDLLERKVICVDLVTKGGGHRGGNNVESNRASIEQVLQAVLSITTTKATLYDLFEIHALSRGVIVDSPEEADTVYSMDEGTVTPKDITVINSEYMVG